MVISIQSILTPLIITLTCLPKKAKPQWKTTVALNKLYMGLGFVLRIIIGNMLPKSLFGAENYSNHQVISRILSFPAPNCLSIAAATFAELLLYSELGYIHRVGGVAPGNCANAG